MNEETSTAARAARIDAVVDAAIAQERIVGAVVLVAEDGAIVHRRAAGHADREAGTPVRPDTVFRLASVTKPMVSAAALALVEAGALSLEDPVARFLPSFRPRLADGSEPAITIRQLMTHTSGLIYGYDKSAGISEGMDRPGRGMAENLERIARQPLAFAPGTSWRYSVATDVLGAVLERAGDADLPVVVARTVTKPLGLTDTEFRPSKPERLATAYADGQPRPLPMADHQVVQGRDGILNFSPIRAFDRDSFPSGGGGMVGTAGDFLTFLEAVRTGGRPILSPASVRLLTENAVGLFGTGVDGRGFSLGWSISRDPSASGLPYSPGTWQWGGVYGHFWFVDPVRKLTVVSFTNTAVAGVSGAYPDAIRDAVYGAG